MSSRVQRAGEAEKAAPVVWRNAGGPPETVRAADAPDANRGSSQEQDDERQREIQARVEAARQKGLAQGEATGAQRAAVTLEPAMKAFRAMAEELESQSRVRRAEVEEDLVKLAIAIARRVLHREIATDPEAILGLVKAAASKLNAREVRRLRLSPPYFSVIAAHRAALDLPPGLQIEADESVGPGSVLFETTRGELDASIGTQLAEIERGLTDIVWRKSR